MSFDNGFDARDYLISMPCFRFNKSELEKGTTHNLMLNAANEYEALNARIDELHDICLREQAQVKELKEKLSEFQEGIPIEKAKECGDYYCLDLGYCVATYFENGKWYYSDDGPNRNPCEVSNRLYPLPSTETKEGE